MMKFSLPVKVGLLMTIAVALVSAAGYLTYRSLSSIVASVEVKSRPDLRLLIIRDIATDLDNAENSVRMYRLTQKEQDIKPYYSVIGSIDDKIDSLRGASYNDTTLLAQIDTISILIEENMLVWDEMIDLYQSDSLENYIHALTAKIAVGTLNKKKSETSILKRVFSRKALKEEARAQEIQAQQEIISHLNRIEQQDSIKNSLLLATESKLAITGEIRDRLYLLITRMENEVIRSIHSNAQAADQLAYKTFQWLALFAVLGTLLIISVLLVVVRYVRKTREYQEALERSRQETENLAKTRELFVANMSHEIRTPVNAIYGFTEQLVHEQLNEKSRKMLGVIRSTSEHLMQIVNDILDYSRLQNARIELEKTDFNLQTVFEEIRLLFAKNVQNNHSHLYFTISNGTPEILYGDAHRLKQILFNLVGNAVKFTANGEICLSAGAGNLIDNSFDLILSVRDTGIGISKEMQGRVFDDFTQAEAGTSRKYGGTGLGLSIVKKLVELHNGKIELESLVGKGTTITCILPYATGNKQRIREVADIPYIPDYVRNVKILVVDDEEYNRMLFKTILTRWHVVFDEVDDGIQAIEKIQSGSYDLVFMDVRMPGLDGMEAASRIRNQVGLSAKELPIIGTSANHAPEDMNQYRMAGMNAFLPKPFTEKMLLELILSVLKGKTDEKEVEAASVEAVPASAGSGVSSSAGGLNVNLTNIYHLANNDISFVRQLLISFIESTEEGLTSLQDAVDSRDLSSIYEIAHKISSPCKHVGADGLYSRLKMIEEQARNIENISILAKLTGDSAREFLEIKKGLQIHLGKI